MNTSKDGMMEELPSLDRTTTFVAGTVFSIASLVSYGNADISALGFSASAELSKVLTSVAGIDISMASVVALASLVAVYIGNNADLTDFSNHQSVAGVITLFTVVAVVLSPDLVSWLSADNMRAIAFFVIQLIGFVSTAEMVEIEDKYGHLRGG